MKFDCNIIKDLLPLYHDEVCSRESKDAVENHMKECESCRKYYQEINASDIVEDVTYEAEREKKKSKILKKVKRGLIITGILIAIGILAVVALFVGPWIYMLAGIVFTRPEVDKDVSHYNQYFGENVKYEYTNRLGMDVSIFPEEIVEEMRVEDFITVYYNPFDPQYLSYLVVSYEESAYKQEIERLQAYESTDYLGNYGATGFAEAYTLEAINADDYQGFVYALSDGKDTIIYVELLFCNYFYDLNYKKYIPEKYLPIGFDATQDNEYKFEP